MLYLFYDYQKQNTFKVCMLWSICICIFQAYRLGEPLKGYLVLSSETTSQSGIGFKNIDRDGFDSKEKGI